MERNTYAATEPNVGQFDYDDHTVIAVDFGPQADPAVDVVDGTAIVIDAEEQREIDLPEGDVRAFTRNGVVTIDVRL